MKKIISFILIVIVVVGVVAIIATNRTGFAGTYKFESKTYTDNTTGSENKIKVGDNKDGVLVTDSWITLEIRSNKTWSMSGAETGSGTWVETGHNTYRLLGDMIRECYFYPDYQAIVLEADAVFIKYDYVFVK